MSPKRRSKRDFERPAAGPSRRDELRIIGGKLRGRRFPYDGHPATRPMKDRVREAVFNLIGPAVIDKFVIDLFAGTGALAFEALSRAAWRALAVERRFPTAGVIEKSASQLGIQDKIEVVAGDAFFWAERLPRSTSRPWLVFICPPYDLYVVSRSEMLTLIERLIAEAPIGSLFVLESDERFDPASLPNAEFWDLRDYSPARIAVFEKASRR